MADAKQCDRCGAFYAKRVNLPQPWTLTKYKGLLADIKDLCPSCLDSLAEWYGKKKGETTDEEVK